MKSTDQVTEEGRGTRLDESVDQASMDSFPASDPPSFWGGAVGEAGDHRSAEAATGPGGASR